MACRIIKDKSSDEEFLIPYCYPVMSHWSNEGVTDREIIKAYCSCNRTTKAERYEIHTKDEVVAMIRTLEQKIQAKRDELTEMEEELEGIKCEVFMLNTVEVVDFAANK